MLNFDLLLKNFNIGPNLNTIRGRALIFHMSLCIPYDKTFHIPYSGKFSLGSYFRDFADCIRSRENKNRKNLFQQKFKGRFIWNRENKNRKNYFTHFHLKIAKIFVRENFPLYGSTISFELVTLTFNFDLLFKNFNFGCYLVMVAARWASLSSDNSYCSSFNSYSMFKSLKTLKWQCLRPLAGKTINCHSPGVGCR